MARAGHRLTARSFEGAADLRLMQDALSLAYDETDTRVGDIAWRARYHTPYEHRLQIRLWFERQRLAGYAWLRTRGGLDLFAVPEHRTARFWAEMVGWALELAAARRLAGDDLASLHTWFCDEAELAGVLEARGFERWDEAGGEVLLCTDLTALPEPVVPDGYALGWVADDDDLHARVEGHRAAWAPSDFSLDLYRRVRATWPYRPQLDRVVRLPAGEVVACCIAWLDERNRAGLIEPVGTHPAHAGRGLARAVVGDALRELRRLGATSAQVGVGGPAARAAYLAAGFRPWRYDVGYRKLL